MTNHYFKVYDVIRIYKQKQIIMEVKTWVKKREYIGFSNYKCLNSFSIFEHQL